jgi:hypothetical protein
MENQQQVFSYIQKLEKEMEAEQMRRMNVENQLNAISNMPSSQDNVNLVEYQLDLTSELNKIYHLISGHELRVDSETGTQYWVEPSDDRLKDFSDYGVKKIMSILNSYAHKGTLLSFYDEDTIKGKVLDIAIEIIDLFQNKYESILYYSTPEQLYEKFMTIYKNYYKEFEEIDDHLIYEKCIVWSLHELKEKVKHMPLHILMIVDLIHSSFMRAYQGKERQSLGERGININQNNANQMQGFTEQNKFSMFKPSTWK